MSLILLSFLLMSISSILRFLKKGESQAALATKMMDAGTISILVAVFLIILYVYIPFLLATILNGDLSSGSNLLITTLTLIVLSAISVVAGYLLLKNFNKATMEAKNPNRIWMRIGLALILFGMLLAVQSIWMHQAYTSHFKTAPPGCL
jgi:hypothetical protein